MRMIAREIGTEIAVEAELPQAVMAAGAGCVRVKKNQGKGMALTGGPERSK